MVGSMQVQRSFLNVTSVLLKNNRIQTCCQGFKQHRRYSDNIQNDKLYELRQYYMLPNGAKPFLEMAKDKISVRNSYSKQVGFWTSELGAGINDIVHLWEYDNLRERADVRMKLAANKDWQDGFLAKALPQVQRQENQLLKCFPGTDVVYPTEKGGVYELEMVAILQDMEASRLLQDWQRPGATLAGAWYTVLAHKPLGWLLWHHRDIDNIVDNPSVVPDEKVMKSIQARLMLPCPWSTMH